ncbi:MULTISPECIES: DUF349 domain-containing protein [Roseivirga]|uniref:Uncharacterized protein n=1 Tax=Roseivirga spongicola TaxID=333140 RepID=A0A150XES4_9BACT|nr:MULTISPECIES: DUF349 domain-containing protein [Roseivirga]KYG77200.1 hypothetical protein AWW68_00065 [Roseivirga spongicola]MBO6496623.1 DUF349 domain-containing protein [Roseivirga sp.]MBO6662718.1 DUF349 domain-containing protein [Roseivirga sp.]MBO6762455.1 DUF349 domain-containing protein [Roseivirga sp.]MBO6909725.1 DUF349 domain-containing protein [Roseivirga sp.]
MEYGYIKEGKVFRNAFLDFPEREIGVVKENDESTFQYFTERFQSLEKEIEEIKEKVENQSNKGSYLMKVTNLKEGLSELDALGDFEAAHTTLTTIEGELNEYIIQNRHKNLQIKTALLEELKVVAKSHEWKSATAAVKEIQQKWIKTGAVDAEHRDRIEGEFKELTNSFFERKAEFYAELEKMMEEKEADYAQFVEKASKTLANSDASKLRDVQKQLMEEWKALGKIKPEKHSAFWNEFQGVLKSAFNKAKKSQSNKKASAEENEKSKRELLGSLEKLNEQIVPEVNLNQVRKDWKSIGFTSKSVTPELNESFMRVSGMLSEKIFLNQLLNKKAKKGISPEERDKLRIKLLYDLLNRDVNELKTFELNVEKFNTAKGLDSLLDQKLEQQKRKVEIKRELLKQLKSAQNQG